MKHYSTKCKLW